jgi:hypothetical protein
MAHVTARAAPQRYVARSLPPLATPGIQNHHKLKPERAEWSKSEKKLLHWHCQSYYILISNHAPTTFLLVGQLTYARPFQQCALVLVVLRILHSHLNTASIKCDAKPWPSPSDAKLAARFCGGRELRRGGSILRSTSRVLNQGPLLERSVLHDVRRNVVSQSLH